MSDFPTYLIGSVEYVQARVAGDTVLDAQTVTITVNGTIHAAEWTGTSGTTRVAQTVAPIDFTAWTDDLYPLSVRYTDLPESPLIPAGYIRVRRP